MKASSNVMSDILPRAGRLYARIPQSTGQNRVAQILVGVLVPFCLATIFVLLRFWVRGYMTRTWGNDDTFLLIAWIFGLATLLVGCIATLYGFGYHLVNIPSENVPITAQLILCFIVLYQITLGASKLSACLFSKRIFHKRAIQLLLTCMMVFIVVYTVSSFVPVIVICQVRAKFWDHSCATTLPWIFYLNGACNTGIDILLIVVAVHQVLGLKMAKRQKIAILSIIAVGWLVVAAALTRMILNERQPYLSRDHTYTRVPIMIWSMIEVSVGLLCLSATTLNPLLLKYGRGFTTFLGDAAYSISESVHRNLVTHFERKNEEIPIPYSQTLTHTICEATTSPQRGRTREMSESSESIWKKKTGKEKELKSESTEDVLEQQETRATSSPPQDVELGIYRTMSVCIKYEKRPPEGSGNRWSDHQSDNSEEVLSKDFM